MLRLARFLLGRALLASFALAVITLSICTLDDRALAQGTGRSLDIQPGARQNGMGAAGVALLGDPSESVWWNPASLGFARTFSGQFTYAELVPGLASDVRYYNGAAVVPVGSVGGIGVGYTHLSYGRSEGTDASGVLTGFFASSEASPSVSIGVQPVSGFSIGGTLKVIRIKLAPSAAGGVGETFGVDAGALLRVPANPVGLGLGVNFQNLGPKVTFLNEDQASPLSRNLKAGVALDWSMPMADDLVIGGAAVADFNQSLVTDPFYTWNGGLEAYVGYVDRARIAVRGGYYYDPLGDISDWTFGAGARIFVLTADAGWIPQARNSDLRRVLKLTAGLHSGWPRYDERDSDQDGVPDSRDKSPDTPKGVIVDAFGVPIDTDGDGIFDGHDRSPNTPRGVLVDMFGAPLDTDRDGVFDGLDQCPRTPRGTGVDERGCARDGDGDGVADGSDACPETPAGATVDARGCPRDEDGDGVPDGLDRCAGTASGARVDAGGCPVETPISEAELLDTGSLRLEHINFETGSADLMPEALPRLDAVAAILTKWSELKIEIAGHTDSLDSEGHNMNLSRERAQAVLAYLTERFPSLEPGRFVVTGYGEERPLVPNDSPDHMARNRRVEFTVLNREILERRRPSGESPAGR